MNNSTFILTALFLVFGMATAFGQQTITLNKDLVLTETLVITEDTNYEGNGFSIICDDCHPAVFVKDGARVHFQNVNFPRVYHSWISLQYESFVTWDSSKMRGYIRKDL